MLQRLITSLALCIVAVATTIAQTPTTKIPRLIDYQGVLTDNNGKPIASPATITVNLYPGNDLQPDGTSDFTEVHSNVIVDQTTGAFHIVIGERTDLGTTKGIPPRVTFDRPYWLELSVGGTKFIPTKLNPVPYAMRAVSVEYTVPIGTIVAYFGEVNSSDPLPDDWLVCDGQAFNTSQYPRLAERLNLMGMVQNRTPDLRGMFLRGSNYNAQSNQPRSDTLRDPDAESRTGGSSGQKIGSVQRDAFQGHVHEAVSTNTMNGTNGTATVEYGLYGSGAPGAVRNDVAGTGLPLNPNTIGGTPIEPVNVWKTYGAARISTETRPSNVGVNWIIKAR